MAGEGKEEVTIADVYQAMLSQREWFDDRADALEASVRADVGALRDELVAIRVAEAGLPCKAHEEDIKSLKGSVNMARILAGVPAALSALVAGALALMGITGWKPPSP